MNIRNIIRRYVRRNLEKTESGKVTTVPWAFLTQENKGVDYVSSSELAMRIATVYRCIDILSKGIAQLPLLVMRNAGGWYEEDEEGDLNYLLSVRPNSRHTAFELMRNTVIQMVTQGNAYIIPRVGYNGWEDLALVCPACCTYDPVANEYVISDNVNKIYGTYEADEVIHLRNMSLDGGYTGVSTIQYAARVLAISANADKDNIETFKTGGLLRGFVSGKGGQTIGFGALQDSQLNTVAENVERQLNSGKNIFSLPGEMGFSQISLSPADIELLATKTFNVLEICRFFGVHPDKVFAQQSTNYKASEMSQVAFLTDTLQPYLRQIENEFQVKLIPRALHGKYRVDFNTESIMQTDLTTRAAYIEKTIATGVRTVNSWRCRMGQRPVEGGDVPLVSTNLAPLGSEKLSGGKINDNTNE